MRIWFAASIPSSAYGSVHRSMKQLAFELRRYGHTTEIFFAHPRKNPSWFRFSIGLALRLFFFFWKRPQWIIARSSDGLISLVITRLFRMKTRIALQNYGWEERINELERRLPSSLVLFPTPWQTRSFGFLLLRYMLKKISLCICGTVDEARWLRNRYPAIQNKLSIVPNGVTSVTKPFWPMQSEFPPSFLMVGRFTWKKAMRNRTLRQGNRCIRTLLKNSILH